MSAPAPIQAQKFRSGWLPSFLPSYYFASWFYARHIEGNYATLIFQTTAKYSARRSHGRGRHGEYGLLGEDSRREMPKKWKRPIEGHVVQTFFYARLPGL
jgi:hypothetical protein